MFLKANQLGLRMKSLFGIILATIFLTCFGIILFGNTINPAIIALTPISFIVFVVYFCSVFLNLEISSKTISIRKRVSDLESNQQELKNITTALYKLLLINFGLINKLMDTGNFKKMHKLISKEIEQYFDINDLDEFLDKSIMIKKELPETSISKRIKSELMNSENLLKLIESLVEQNLYKKSTESP